MATEQPIYARSLRQIRDDLRAGTYSSVEATQSFLSRIDSLDNTYNSFITVTREAALAQAEAADAALAAGDTKPLTGVPIAHKDIFCTQGVRTSCGSKMLDNFVSPYNATVVNKLLNAGSISLGKTNMDEFAMGSSTETSFYGATRNPWNSNCVPGGSSGGSAAAVAARLVPAATGTDTGGSIRQPAALCGLTGLKPTYGRISRYGIVAYASSLDQAGPMATTAEDCALMLESMAGMDPMDSTSVDQPVDKYSHEIQAPIDGLKIGLPKEYFDQSLSTEAGALLEAAIKQLEQLGAEFKEVSLPNAHLAIPTYYVLAPAEASTNLSRYDGVRYGHRCDNPADLQDLYCRTRSEGFGEEVQRRILVGTYVLSAGYYDAYYRKAQKIRRLILNDFSAAFADVDVVLGPVTRSSAFKLGEKMGSPLEMYREDLYTTPVNLAGLPSISAPCGLINGLPYGLQLIGNHFAESRILQVAHQYQQVTHWHLQQPANLEN